MFNKISSYVSEGFSHLKGDHITDKGQMNTAASKEWSKIERYFTSDTKENAKFIFETLCDPKTLDENKVQLFYDLKGLASPTSQPNFIDTVEDGIHTYSLGSCKFKEKRLEININSLESSLQKDIDNENSYANMFTTDFNRATHIFNEKTIETEDELVIAFGEEATSAKKIVNQTIMNSVTENVGINNPNSSHLSVASSTIHYKYSKTDENGLIIYLEFRKDVSSMDNDMARDDSLEQDGQVKSILCKVTLTLHRNKLAVANATYKVGPNTGPDYFTFAPK